MVAIKSPKPVKARLGIAFRRLLTLRMQLGMRLRWLRLRAEDYVTSSTHARHVPRGFTASTQRWHRRLQEVLRRSVSFAVVEEARTDKLVAPVVAGKAPASFLRGETFHCPQLFVVGIPHGRLLGHTGEVMDPNGIILADLSLMRPESVQPWVYERHKPFRLNTSPPAVESLGRACTVVSQYASSNYFHWMLNLLPRFDLLRRAGVCWSDLDAIVVNELGSGFQRETLDRVGIPGDKLVEAGPAYYGEAEMLYATRSLREAGHRCPCVLEFVRSLFTDCLCDSGGRKIYVSRSDALTRRVINEAELVPLLAARNLEVVSLSGMTACDQARLFSQADVIVAPHGAGLANLVFCRPNTKVIELLSRAHLRQYYWELASARDLQYYCMISASDADGSSTSKDPRLRDFQIDPDPLKHVMDLAQI